MKEGDHSDNRDLLDSIRRLEHIVGEALHELAILKSALQTVGLSDPHSESALVQGEIVSARSAAQGVTPSPAHTGEEAPTARQPEQTNNAVLTEPEGQKRLQPTVTRRPNMREERKQVRHLEQELRKDTDALGKYQVRDAVWSAKARSLICMARYILDRIQELNMDSNSAHDDLVELGSLMRQTQQYTEFFGCNTSRYMKSSEWRSLSRAYATLGAAIPLVDLLEDFENDHTKLWEKGFNGSAAAESLVYRLILDYAPDCSDQLQMDVHSRLRCIQGDVYTPAWSSSVPVDQLEVEESTLKIIWGRLRNPETETRDPRPVPCTVNYLDLKAILDLHEELVRFFKGEDDPIEPPGPRDLGLLESALTRPATSLGGVEKYETVAHKGAALTHSLILNHPFHNGNKRTALGSLVLFLRRNDLILQVDEEALFSFLLSVAGGTLLGGKRDPDEEVAAMRDFIQKWSVSVGQPKAMELSQFIKQCEKLDCNVRTSRDKRSWVVRNGRRQITIGKSTRELDGPVVKVYVSRLGLSESHTGMHLDSFITDGIVSPKSIIAKYNRIMRRLAAY